MIESNFFSIKNLLNNLDKELITNEKLFAENKELKVNLNEQKLKLKETLEKNRPLEINNNELKNTISRYIINNKKMHEKINLLESSKNLEFDETDKKVKFYQDENIRLSSELLVARNKNETIKLNLNNTYFKYKEFKKHLNELIENKRKRVEMGKINFDYIKSNLGATKNVISYLKGRK